MSHVISSCFLSKGTGQSNGAVNPILGAPWLVLTPEGSGRGAEPSGRLRANTRPPGREEALPALHSSRDLPPREAWSTSSSFPSPSLCWS